MGIIDIAKPEKNNTKQVWKYTGNKESKKTNIIRITKLNVINGIRWLDWSLVPQGYMVMDATPIPKPKGMRKIQKDSNGEKYIAHNGRYLIEPTDEQIIQYAKRLMGVPDMYNAQTDVEVDTVQFKIIVPTKELK